MSLQKLEEWQWFLDLWILLNRMPPLTRLLLVFFLVIAFIAILKWLSKFFDYEVEQAIDLPFGIKIKGRKPKKAAKLSIICTQGATTDSQVQIKFRLVNTGSASTTQIQCNLFECSAIPIGKISQEPEFIQTRKFDTRVVDGVRSFWFAEDPIRACHPDSSTLFASSFIPRSTAAFDIDYRIQAIEFDESGQVHVDPNRLQG